MEKKYRIVLFGFIIALILGGSVAADFANRQTQEHTIRSINKVEKVHGDSESFTTEVYYLVTTDKGAYKVVMDGFNAAPQCAGVKVDSTYTLTTRGINFPFLDIYPKIIAVE